MDEKTTSTLTEAGQSNLVLYCLTNNQRSPVRIRPSAPDLRHSCGGDFVFPVLSQSPERPCSSRLYITFCIIASFTSFSHFLFCCLPPVSRAHQPGQGKNTENFSSLFRQNISCFFAFRDLSSDSGSSL